MKKITKILPMLLLPSLFLAGLGIRGNSSPASAETPDPLEGFLPWDSADSLPTEGGKWYLTKDVTLSSYYDTNFLLLDGTEICLNGFNITSGVINDGPYKVFTAFGNVRFFGLGDVEGGNKFISYSTQYGFSQITETCNIVMENIDITLDKGISWADPSLFMFELQEDDGPASVTLRNCTITQNAGWDLFSSYSDDSSQCDVYLDGCTINTAYAIATSCTTLNLHLSGETTILNLTNWGEDISFYLFDYEFDYDTEEYIPVFYEPKFFVEDDFVLKGIDHLCVKLMDVYDDNIRFENGGYFESAFSDGTLSYTLVDDFPASAASYFKLPAFEDTLDNIEMEYYDYYLLDAQNQPALDSIYYKGQYCHAFLDAVEVVDHYELQYGLVSTDVEVDDEGASATIVGATSHIVSSTTSFERMSFTPADLTTVGKHMDLSTMTESDYNYDEESGRFIFNTVYVDEYYPETYFEGGFGAYHLDLDNEEVPFSTDLDENSFYYFKLYYNDVQIPSDDFAISYGFSTFDDYIIMPNTLQWAFGIELDLMGDYSSDVLSAEVYYVKFESVVSGVSSVKFTDIDSGTYRCVTEIQFDDEGRLDLHDKYTMVSSTFEYQNETTLDSFTTSFMNTITCDNGVTAPSKTGWASVKEIFDKLDPSDKAALKNATYSLSGDTATGTGDTTDAVAEVAARYDYIIEKYGTTDYPDFMGRTVGENSNTINKVTQSNTILIVSAISTIGLLAILVICKKRKTN